MRVAPMGDDLREGCAGTRAGATKLGGKMFGAR